jgi:adenine-specific DNA methylase
MTMSIEKSVLEKFLQLPLEKQKEVLEFVESIWQKFRGSKKEESEISKSEHERILRVLDGVSALSVETGPPVSNRDHDSHLYGGH